MPVNSAFSEEHDTFRNELASVARDGRRRWIYARQPSGRLYRARTILGWALLGFLVFAPFITVGGQPLMMLNVLERRFVLLGVLFRPQDFHLVVLIALTVLVTIVLTTVVAGRIWCGWLCPQTVFMELVFRKIEYLIDGSAEQQVRRARGPRGRLDAIRAVAKQTLFFGLSFVIANVFLAWIIGARELKTIVTDPPARHLGGLATILTFSFVFYLVFSRFREQACVLACPYGRMMSALIDSRTVTVTYDALRGEPRSRVINRAGAGSKPRGDCIDCHQCVTVCPTGIDIRNGVQLECVNCTACIDACDGVMARIGRKPGLIRFTSHSALAEGHQSGASFWRRHRGLSGRAVAYGGVWLVLVAVVSGLLAVRRDLDVLILRQPGTLYTTVSGGDVANFYNVQAFNRTGHPTAFSIEVTEPRGASVTPLGRVGDVEPFGLADGRLLLRIPRSSLAGASTPVRFSIRTGNRVVQTIESSFVGPAR